MASYFTDEFQVSDGKKYPMTNPGAGVEPAPVLSPNTQGNRWERFLNGSVNEGPILWNAAGTTALEAKDLLKRGTYWPVPFSNPAISIKIGNSVVVGDEIALYVSLQANAVNINGYVAVLTVTEVGKANLVLYRVTNGAAQELTGPAAVTFKLGDVWSFANNEGFLRIFRNGVAQQGISDYVFGVGNVALYKKAQFMTFEEVMTESYDASVIGRTQVVQFKEEINYTNFGVLPNSYQLPPAFISNFTITAPVGTILSLEELRAEVVPVFYGASLNGLVTQAEVQAFGNSIAYVLGAVNAVVMRDPFQYRFQGTTTPYEWRNGMYVPAFRGAGIIERLEIIPSRRLSLDFSSHEATIKFGLVEDPIQSQAVNKIFNPGVNIQGGKTLGFGIETVPGRLENVSAPPIFVRYVHFLEVRMAARYRIYELGERSS